MLRIWLESATHKNTRRKHEEVGPSAALAVVQLQFLLYHVLLTIELKCCLDVTFTKLALDNQQRCCPWSGAVLIF